MKINTHSEDPLSLAETLTDNAITLAQKNSRPNVRFSAFCVSQKLSNRFRIVEIATSSCPSLHRSPTATNFSEWLANLFLSQQP
jgi:hypothetical protein